MTSASKKIDPNAKRVMIRKYMCGGMYIPGKVWKDGKPTDPKAKKYVNEKCLKNVSKAYDVYARGLNSRQKIVYNHFVTGMVGQIYIDVNNSVKRKYGGKLHYRTVSEANKKMLEYTKKKKPATVSYENPFTQKEVKTPLLTGGLAFARQMALCFGGCEGKTVNLDYIHDTDPNEVRGGGGRAFNPNTLYDPNPNRAWGGKKIKPPKPDNKKDPNKVRGGGGRDFDPDSLLKPNPNRPSFEKVKPPKPDNKKDPKKVRDEEDDPVIIPGSR